MAVKTNITVETDLAGVKSKQVRTTYKTRSYMGGHLILELIFHTTLPYLNTATWALGPGMTSAPTSHLEP